MKILITGASSGIGEALARLYATKENELILLARREDRLLQIKSELQNAKNVEIFTVDVCEFDELREKIKSLDNIDMVILNAGMSLGHSLEITPFEDFKKLYDIHAGFKEISGSNVTAGFDVELLLIAKKLGYKIKEVPVEWLYVETRRVSPIRDSINGLRDLLLIFKNKSSGKYNL